MSAQPNFDFQPTLVGPTMSLRPLRADDLEALHAAAADPLIWEQHPEPTRYQREVFERGFFSSALASGSSLVALENASGRLIGSSRYYEWDAASREVAIGFTFLARDHWGGSTNGEMKRLMLDHAFRWARVVWLHVGANNLRSRKAAEKIGAKLSHIAPRTLGAGTIDYAYYTIEATS